MVADQDGDRSSRDRWPDAAGCRESLASLRVVVVDGGIAPLYCARLFAAHGASVTVVGGSGDEDHREGFRGWLCQGSTRTESLDQVPWTPEVVVGAAVDVDAVRTQVGGFPVVLSISWFAPDGPYAELAGSDEVMWALSGLGFAIGEPDGPPVLPRGCGPQLLAGLNAFTAGLAALLEPPPHRPSTVTVDVHESMAMLAETAGVRARDGVTVARQRLGVNRFGSTYPTTSYRSADGWVGLTCLTPPQWRAVCSLIERQDLADDPRFVTSQARVQHADDVDALLGPAFEQRSTEELVAGALERRLPLCPMSGPGDLPRDEHWRQRGSFAPVGSGRAVAPTLPITMAFTGRPVDRWQAADHHGPLSGLRVADFTMGWAGPYATRLLADLGADVVKVEHDDHPDWWRGWDPPTGTQPPSTELQPHFNAMNRNKLGVSLDLRRPEGVAAAERLIASADVVVENFAAGVFESLGLGPEVQRRLNPDVISLSLPPFGSSGPLADLRAYGSTVEQASGLPFVNGQEEWPPSLIHVALGDPVAGMYASAAALVAITARARSGGSVVEVTQVECLFQLGAEHVIEASGGATIARTGNARPGLPLSCVARSRDDAWVYVAVADGSGWARLRELLDAPQLGEPPAPLDGTPAAGRILEEEEAVRRWLSERPAEQAEAELRAIGALAAVIRRQGDVGFDGQHEACGLWGTLERPHVGRHSMAHLPFRFDGRRAPLRRPAPLLGHDTAEVLAELAELPHVRSMGPGTLTAPGTGTATRGGRRQMEEDR